jgi:hypothetical protein
MKTTTVHLEDVTRAARQGVALAFAVSLLGLVVLLVAGLATPIAAIVAAASLIIGIASAGFGLVGRMALPTQPFARRTARPRRRALGPVRVPQTR